MSGPAFARWIMALDLAAHLGAGIVIGILTLRGLRRTVRFIGEGGRGAMAIAWMVARLLLLATLLTLASLEGAPQLLALAAGIMGSRWCMLRTVSRSMR